MADVKPVRVNGRDWHTFACEYTTPDGKFGFEIKAISPEHASYMLQDLKESAVLLGQLYEIIPFDDGETP